MDTDWGAAVAEAAAAGDQPALAVLFDARAAQVGREQASRDWMAALAGYDAGAQTG